MESFEVAAHASPEAANVGLAVLRDNVEIIRRALDAFSRRDVQAALEIVDPEIELFAPGTAAVTRGGKSYRGVDGIFSYFHDIGRVWDELEVIPQEYRDVGDHILVFGRLRARRLGGLLVDVPAQWLVRLRRGKVVWAYAYTSREDALGAVRNARGADYLGQREGPGKEAPRLAD